ncbi:MAG: serine hydrolase [Croceibacterium sp.]
MRTWGKLLAAAAIVISAPAAAQEAVGNWAGVLEVTESVKLPLVVHILRDDSGAVTGTMDSPTQGAIGLPLAAIVTAPGTLMFTVPTIQGAYTSRWDANAKSWNGQWSQAGMTWPLVLAVPPPPQPLPADWTLPSDADLSSMIEARIAPRAGEGIVVGVLGPDGRRVVAGGPAGATAYNGDTLFEIGSISKVFTALILSDMVNKGQVALDDPAEKYLPAGATMPARNGRKITLADLATHTSGLPRMPDNMPFGDPDDPFADYSETLMLQFLAGYELPRDVGEKWEYSNLGVGLLGYLLARAAGTDYPTLLHDRVTGPLGLDDTVIALSPAQTARFAQGYDQYMRPAKPWNLATLSGAGAIRSSVNDMLKFAAAALDPGSPIAAAMTTALSVRRDIGNPRVEQALGWEIAHPEPDRDLLIHDGGTGGYRSVLALEPSKGTASVALVNSAAEPSASDLGIHALIGSPVAPTPPVPAAPPAASVHTEITLPAADLDKVVGRYVFGSGVVFNVEHVGNALRAQRQGSATGPVLPIFPEAPLTFFWKAVDAQITFTTDASGTVTGAVFTQSGQTLTGQRALP